jgi:DNA-binding MarR family transcriptional regulator
LIHDFSQPSDKPEAAATERLLLAWWHLGQTMKQEVAPMLERKHGLEFVDFVVLNAIHDGACYPSQLSERMAVRPSHVSRLLDEATKNGLLTRTLDPNDSRRVRLELTEKGLALLHETYDTMEGVIAAGVSDMSQAEIVILSERLERISQRVRIAHAESLRNK